MEQEPTGFFFQSKWSHVHFYSNSTVFNSSFIFLLCFLKEYIKNQSDTQISYKLSPKLLNLH